ncbi:MAG TPA: matrixin family metalloprotease [Pyrinomonadaceae bacterium]|nr:matrixin family metalloprotease [Pyrinomonadaceae bacterium]
MLRLLKTVLITAAVVSLAAGGVIAGTVSGAEKETSLRWPSSTIKVTISSSFYRSAANILPGSDIDGALTRSFSRWESAAGIRFELTRADDADVSPAGRAGDGRSIVTASGSAENMLLFSDGLEDSPAATRLFYDKSGNITEADIALNPMQRFSTGGEAGTYDLESVLTHEVGHMLGLDHSPVLGALMYEHQAQNGIFGASFRKPVELSEADETALRAIYGPGEFDIECCSELDLQIGAPDSIVWGEVNGRVTAVATSDDQGDARFRGLLPGLYSFYSRSGNGAVDSLGTVDLAVGDVRSFNARPLRQGSRVSLDHVGLSGRLYQMPVALAAGRVHTVYLGGQGLAPSTAIGTNAAGIQFDMSSFRLHDYGPGISVISVNVFIPADLPAGAYSIWAADAAGRRSYAVGAFSIFSARRGSDR